MQDEQVLTGNVRERRLPLALKAALGFKPHGDRRSTQAIPSSSSPPVSFPSIGSVSISADAMDDLENLCVNEFGLKLRKLQSQLNSLADEQRSALERFCVDIPLMKSPEGRREIAQRLIMDLVSTTELATDRYKRLLVKMQAALLANVQTENEKSSGDVSRLENEVQDLKSALRRMELEKDCVKDEADRRFEQEKNCLEVTLRQNLQACQICRHNPRNVVIMPCLHAHFCADCVDSLQKSKESCPTCRSVVRGTVPYIA